MGVTTTAPTTRKAYDKITLWVSREDMHAIHQKCDAVGESVNAFVRRVLYEAIEKDNVK